MRFFFNTFDFSSHLHRFSPLKRHRHPPHSQTSGVGFGRTGNGRSGSPFDRYGFIVHTYIVYTRDGTWVGDCYSETHTAVDPFSDQSRLAFA